ncbi:MAG: Selenide, water dikinase [Cyanobacteria bacterium RYN_339]|nr:Selenide, water dikinase [Cyanobacteria bacterium RYN_339]
MIYLDYNASAPLDPRVREAMTPYLDEFFGNSRSGHAYGVRVKEAIERARGQVAALVGADPAEILFTSGGSEANNLAIKGLAWAHPRRKHLVRGALEHYSVAYACDFLARQGWRQDVVAVDGVGRLDQAAMARVVGDDTLLVCVQHANNEIGTVQDVAAIARLARAQGARVHCDAAQSVGKLPVKVDALEVDLLSLAGHKFCGPQGIGALYRRGGLGLEPLIHGAGHEDGLRSGTHSVALIVGLGEAAALAEANLAETTLKLATLRDRLFDGIRAVFPAAHLNGDPAHRLPHTLNVSFPGFDGNDLLASLPELAATTGAACHSGLREPSMALKAIGAPLEIGLGAIRLSLGRFTTEAEIDRAAKLIGEAVAVRA